MRTNKAKVCALTLQGGQPRNWQIDRGLRFQTSKRLEVVEGIHPAPGPNTPYIKSALEVAGIEFIGTPTGSTCNPNLTCIAWSRMSGEPADRPRPRPRSSNLRNTYIALRPTDMIPVDRSPLSNVDLPAIPLL